MSRKGKIKTQNNRMGFFRFFIQYYRITVLQLYSFTELHKNIFHNSNTFFHIFLFYLIFICIFAKERMLEQSLLTVFCTFQLLLSCFRAKHFFQVKLNTLFFSSKNLKNFYTFSVLFQNTDYLLIERNMNGFQKLIVSATLD